MNRYSFRFSSVKGGREFFSLVSEGKENGHIFLISERAILMLLRLEGGVDSVFLKNFSKERNIKA